LAVNVKRELNFGLDNFKNQKMLSLDETIAQMIINILFLRPGQLPGMPHVGIDINKYLYKFDTELDTSDILTEIRAQCSPLTNYIDIANMFMAVIEYEEQPLLVLNIPLRTGSSNTDITIGFKKDKDKVTADYSLINLVKNS